MTNPYLLDDSDSQWAELERERVRCDRILARYWRAIPAQERERIAALVPAGHWLLITAGHRDQPGTGTVRLVHDGQVLAEARGRDLARLCRSVLA